MALVVCIIAYGVSVTSGPSAPIILLLLIAAGTLEYKLGLAEHIKQSAHVIDLVVCGALTGVLIAIYYKAVGGMASIAMLNVSDILALHPINLLSLALAIISLHALHVIIYRLRDAIGGIGKGKTPIYYVASYILVLLLTMDTWQLTIGLSLGVFIYFLLLDLHYEEQTSHLLWLMVWSIVFCTFLMLSIMAQHPNTEMIDRMDAMTIFSLSFIMSGVFYMIYALINKYIPILPQSWRFRLAQGSTSTQ